MHRLTKIDNTIGFKASVTFNKSDIPIFSFHFFYNKKGLKIIECHVQGTTKHCMSNNKK
jgi:hypothetical protein